MNFLLMLLLTTFKSLNLDSFLPGNHQVQLLTKSLVNIQNHDKIRYDNFGVYDVTVRNKEQFNMLMRFINNGSDFNLWRMKYNNLHIMVSPKDLKPFLKFCLNKRLQYKILIKNVQRLIDAEQNLQRRHQNQDFNWMRYHSLDEINDWLNYITAQYPNVTEKFTIGTSSEGREICGIKISYKTRNPGIFIESHIHANEWITSATSTWLINELVKETKDLRIRYIAENFDWYIVPVLNVDGFAYSYEKDRLWRKTRSCYLKNNTKSNCFGVDANRNFDFHWLAHNGGSANPCDDTYAGPTPFSEPEIRGLANYINSIKEKINLYLAFHSYGQTILSPFGYTATEQPKNYDDLMHMASAFTDAIEKTSYHTKYEKGSTAKLLYITSGCSADWAYENGINLSYTIEFRDQGHYGFLLPSTNIIPNSKEVLTGIFALIIEADNMDYMHIKYKL